MAELPFFLRECNKFPPPADENNSQDHPRRRAFELVVSVNVLVETKDAAELWFGFLDYKNHNQGNIVLWMCDDLYIATRFHPVHSIFAISRKRKLTDGFNGSGARDVHICHVPSTDVPLVSSRSGSAASSSIASAINTLLQLLAKHKGFKYIEIHRFHLSSGWMYQEPLPASLDALQFFVSQPTTPRLISFEDTRFSADQWRALTFNCNKNVALFYQFKDGVFEALVEAMNHSQCPADLRVCFSGEPIATDAILEFVAAVESTTSLKSLAIVNIQDSSIFLPVCEAISRNHELQYLNLHCWRGNHLSDAQYDLFCSAIASHPTIQTLVLESCFEYSSRSQDRDQIFIQHVSRNKVLCELHFDFWGSMYNEEHVKTTVRPFLEWNRFRPVVYAIKHTKNATRRQFLCTATLKSDKVLKSPAFRFFLLRENADLFVAGFVALGK